MAAERPPPFWSVVVPLYNKQDFIEATLRSALDQTGDEDLEIVVVDDGSKDAGPARVAALGDSRVRLIQQGNAGVSAARNRGIREARGQWVVFLDADDLLHPSALSAYREAQENFPALSAVAGSYVRVPSVDVEKFAFLPYSASSEFRLIDNLPAEILKTGMPFFTSAIAVRRALFDEFEPWFPEGESMGEDLDLWLRIVERYSVGFTSRCVALYRIEVSSSLMGKRVFDHLFPFLTRLEQRAIRSLLSEKVAQASLDWVADARVTLARETIKRGRRSEAIGLLLKARRRAKSIRWWFTWLALLVPSVLGMRG